MSKKAIVFSTERLPKMLIEATELLLKVQQLNKEIEVFDQPTIWLNDKKYKLDEKINNWLATNVVNVK